MTRGIKYENYEAMIRKRADEISRKTGAEFEELFAQGNLVFCETKQKFDHNRGVKFGTILWKNLDSLYNYKKHPAVERPNESIPSEIDQSRWIEFRSCLGNLSDEAIKVLNLIFNSPEKLNSFIPAKHKTMTPTVLSRFLHSEWQWQHKMIWAVIGEIKFALQEF